MKNIIYLTILMFLCAKTSYALPSCNFLIQDNITSLYSTTTPNILNNIYFINTKNRNGLYNTIIFNNNCDILYKRELGDVPIAILSFSDTSNIVFITKGRGSAYAVDVYLITDFEVKPILLDLATRSFPVFDNLSSLGAPNIISCIDICYIYKYNKDLAQYIKHKFQDDDKCVPNWISSYKPTWKQAKEKKNESE